MKTNTSESHIHEKDNAHSLFTKHPLIKNRIRLFLLFFFLGSASLIVGVREFSTRTGNANFFVNLALLGMFTGVVSVLWIMLFLKCPRCRTRVYTPKMMWGNKMPAGKDNYCPVCGFPKEDIRKQEKVEQ